MDSEVLGDRTDSDGEVFTISQAIRPQHTYILGRTGSGKTTLLARLALADIARGDGLLVLDPHGDLVEDIIDHCPPEHLKRIVYLDPSDRQHPVPMNIFECRPGQDKDTVCSEVIGVFKRLYGDSWGFRLEDLLRNLTLVMLDHQLLGNEGVPEEHRYNATLKEAHDFLFNQNMRREYYPYIGNQMVRDFWVHQYDNLGKLRPPATVTFAQINYASSVTNKVRRFLLNTLVFDIMANKDVASTIDLREVMDDKRVLLVNLSKGKLGEDNSALLGSVLLSRLVVAALSRADMPASERADRRFHVIADEFQAFATDSFKLLLSEARKYGVTLTIAHQHREQLDQEMKGATLNCGSLICFRVAGRDAIDLGREFDATPMAVGFTWERDMEEEHSELSSWVERKIVDTSPDQPLSRLRLLYRERSELVNKVARVKLNEERIEHLQSCKSEDHGYCKGRRTPSIRPEDLPEHTRKVLFEYLPRIDELTIEIEKLEQQVPDLAIGGAGKYWIPSSKASGPYIKSRDEHNNEELDYDETQLYRRIPRVGSFSEREREIANSLTQLPNFTALARLANGSSMKLASRPIPQETCYRAIRIHDRSSATGLEYGVPSERRPSVANQPYFADLRRIEAYEAELDEQPDQEPLDA